MAILSRRLFLAVMVLPIVTEGAAAQTSPVCQSFGVGDRDRGATYPRWFVPVDWDITWSNTRALRLNPSYAPVRRLKVAGTAAVLVAPDYGVAGGARASAGLFQVKAFDVEVAVEWLKGIENSHHSFSGAVIADVTRGAQATVRVGRDHGNQTWFFNLALGTDLFAWFGPLPIRRSRLVQAGDLVSETDYYSLTQQHVASALALHIFATHEDASPVFDRALDLANTRQLDIALRQEDFEAFADSIAVATTRAAGVARAEKKAPDNGGGHDIKVFAATVRGWCEAERIAG